MNKSRDSEVPGWACPTYDNDQSTITTNGNIPENGTEIQEDHSLDVQLPTERSLIT